MQNVQLALKDVSRVLGVPSYRIQYALVNGQVEEPRVRVANNRIFEAQDVVRLARHFRRPVPSICEQAAESVPPNSRPTESPHPVTTSSFGWPIAGWAIDGFEQERL